MAVHPVVTAAERGDLAQVRAYVEEDPSLISATTVGGSTPLMLAAAEGHVDVVRYLLGQSADVNHRNVHGDTAVQLSCSRRQVGVLQVLLEGNADVCCENMWGQSPLLEATYEGFEGGVEALLEHGGSDIDARVREDGSTGLHIACTMGYVGLVKRLLEAGADLDMQDTDGDTPMDVARANGRRDCITVLQDWDASYLLHKARRLRDVGVGTLEAPSLAIVRSPS